MMTSQDFLREIELEKQRFFNSLKDEAMEIYREELEFFSDMYTDCPFEERRCINFDNLNFCHIVKEIFISNGFIAEIEEGKEEDERKYLLIISLPE